MYFRSRIDGKETSKNEKKKKEENLDRYKHRCKEGEGRMKRREDKARIKGGVECNREYS